MASLFAHGLVGITMQYCYPRHRSVTRLWFIIIICTILPDIDVLGFFLGIPYPDMWGHRGITHSLFFALCLAFLIMLVWLRDSSMLTGNGLLRFGMLFLATASHGVLDAMTNGGLGVAFFAPFDNTRYFFPWRPILVSPIGIESFFSQRGLRVIYSELLWIALPSLLVMLSAKWWRKTALIR